ncbi:MAG: hypothetical protein QW578_08700, partial [Thermoplasmatales archaeon]
RNTEDRGLEENRLLSNVRQWSSRGKGELIKEISEIYSYFDDQYNSKLFAKHLCDDLYIDNEVLQEVIEGLNHAKDDSYRYDFSIIESDVLGNIYEQYLGNILKTTPKRAKLESSRTHRKDKVYTTHLHTLWVISPKILLVNIFEHVYISKQILLTMFTILHKQISWVLCAPQGMAVFQEHFFYFYPAYIGARIVDT